MRIDYEAPVLEMISLNLEPLRQSLDVSSSGFGDECDFSQFT